VEFVSELTESIELDKITEVLIDGVWHHVTPGTLVIVPFDLNGEQPAPGVGFQTGPRSSSRNREAIYAPLSAVSAVKTVDDARTQNSGR
jgi:hypothetical protein